MDEPINNETLRAEALRKLDRSIFLADEAEVALQKGAPLDCPDVQAFRTAVGDANEALSRISFTLDLTPAGEMK